MEELLKEVKRLANPEKAKILQRFFKTGKGEYGEGDIFIGLTVQQSRKVAKNHYGLDLNSIRKLLSSNIHEHRLVGLLILINKYNKEDNKQEIFNFYLQNSKQINNWDLVDLSAPNIIGQHLINKEKSILYKLASSDNLWEKRISVISTLSFIKNNEFEDSIRISEILLNDKHDLIHKAVGWMLREIVKKDLTTLENFLKQHYKNMPRTMLRYSIEKFPEEKRQAYLKGEIKC